MTATPQPDAASSDPAPPPGGQPVPPLVAPAGAPPRDGAPAARIRLSAPADVVAAVPVLLGFHPEHSLVLIGLAGVEDRGRVGLTVRVDLPAAPDAHRVCADAVSVLHGSGPARAVVVVVADAPDAASTARSRRDVALCARRALRHAGIEVTAVLWAAGTRAGDRWSCCPLPEQRCGCAGTVPDPAATPVAVAAAVQGRAVLPDRAAVRAQLDGDSADRARRSRLRPPPGAQVDRDTDGLLPGQGGTCGDDDHRLLDTAITEAAEGRLVVDDHLTLEFDRALGDAAVRDEALRRCLGPRAPHAEQLWAALTRALPWPTRAHAAALLATCALLRGDGALATLAVERVLGARPRHVLAAVVDASLRDAVTPGRVPGRYAGPSGLRDLLTAVLVEPDGGAAG